jgi:hypothetical protein
MIKVKITKVQESDVSISKEELFDYLDIFEEDWDNLSAEEQERHIMNFLDDDFYEIFEYESSDYSIIIKE